MLCYQLENSGPLSEARGDMTDSIEDAVLSEMLRQFRNLSYELADLLAEIERDEVTNKRTIVQRAVELAHATVLVAGKFISAYDAARDFEEGRCHIH
jgi:hypothetical protein